MREVTLIPGDGIGPEITKSVQAVLQSVGLKIDWEIIDNLDTADDSERFLNRLAGSLKKTRIALKGPTTTPSGGGRRSLNVQIRQRFGLFASVRPISVLPGIQSAYPETNIIVVRENSEDLYAGLEYKIGDTAAHAVKIITRDASLRIARHAFLLARHQKRSKITVVHKANILKLTDGLFLECARKVASEFSDISFGDMLIDNCCMQLVTRPKQFDILLTENLYGDILSDLAAGLVGGLGVAAGGNIGEELAIFEPVHGSALDIAGKNIANPTAHILSAVMMLDHLDEKKAAESVRRAVHKTLQAPQTRTRDLGGNLSTTDFTQALIRNLE